MTKDKRYFELPTILSDQNWQEWYNGLDYVIHKAQQEGEFRNDLKNNPHKTLREQNLGVPEYVDIIVEDDTKAEDAMWSLRGAGAIVATSYTIPLNAPTSKNPLAPSKLVVLPTLQKEWLTWTTQLTKLIAQTWVNSMAMRLLTTDPRKALYTYLLKISDKIKDEAIKIDQQEEKDTWNPSWQLSGTGFFNLPNHYTIPLPDKPTDINEVLELWANATTNKYSFSSNPTMVTELPQTMIPDFTTVGLNMPIGDTKYPYHAGFLAISSDNPKQWGK